jgi:hypothetical protein
MPLQKSSVHEIWLMQSVCFSDLIASVKAIAIPGGYFSASFLFVLIIKLI